MGYIWRQIQHVTGLKYPFLRRLVIEIPFVLFALVLPFVAGGEQVELAGLLLSVEGLWGGWNIIAKATLGLAASILLTATTTVPDILAGLDRLRVPRLITSIAGSWSGISTSSPVRCTA